MMTTLKFATADCKRLLPAVLIDYLWELAADADAETQTFVLSAKYTGTGDVQDILHRRNNFSSWRRVFGYQPVEATVEVRETGFGAIMSLKEERPVPAGVAACSA